MDRYFSYVSGADFPSGTLNKQTYLASGEGTVRACRSRFGAHLLMAKMNQGYSHSRLPQMWFRPVYMWASHREGSLSEHAEWCGFADKAFFFFFFSPVITFPLKQMTYVGTLPSVLVIALQPFSTASSQSRNESLKVIMFNCFREVLYTALVFS